MLQNVLIQNGFLYSVDRFPNRPALCVTGVEFTYHQLFIKASSIAATLNNLVNQDTSFTVIFAYRSVVAYAGVLGILMHGHGYVPLNVTFPVERSKTMLLRSGCRTMIVDPQSEMQIDKLLEDVDYSMSIILPERETVVDLQSKWPMHQFIGKNDMVPSETWQPKPKPVDSPAYILFTSGSTGIPKGVVVTHRNVGNYVHFISQRINISCEDRFSQMFDMTFDLSVADMFVAWGNGACLCSPPIKSLLNPGQFIIDSKITVWFSVPSVAIFMKRLGSLKAGTYQQIRISLFCGEGLPVDVADSWSKAAPNSIVENLYGPTELTIACMFYRYDAKTIEDTAEVGLVPIGYAFPGMTPLVVDEHLREVDAGKTGELLMAGPQLSGGYWNDPEKTSAVFIVPPGKNELFYRTGDLVRKPCHDNPMTYLGRTDNQIKILGHRVELSEIEAVVRKESGCDGVVAVGWPLMQGGASGIEVFIECQHAPSIDIKQKIALFLPNYMMPKKVHFLSRFPLNANGKYDRKALLQQLKEMV